jgi:N utilization substance protein B
MKTKGDPRHIARVNAVKKLFEKTFLPEEKLVESSLALEVMGRQKEIDILIAKNAPAWPIEQISPVDLATLRLAIWELVYSSKKEPYKVIIDEAVEIAKEYGSQTSAGFINGVLGTIVKNSKIS